MKIQNLISNNINRLNTIIPTDKSIGVAGLSGSGKTTFCKAVSDESKKRIVLLLNKSEYQFLFSNILKSNFSAQFIEDMPLTLFLGKTTVSSNPRSTIGTHTGIFKEIRSAFAQKYNLSSEYFSFNNSLNWCPECKGRGYNNKKLCPKCNGTRYREIINDYILEFNNKKSTISQLNDMNAETLLKFAESCNISEQKRNILSNMVAMSIGYLSLNRIISTLSGGELVRLYLSEFITRSSNIAAIIDELSIGLDHDTLLNILGHVEKLGEKNQIIMIDHSDTVLNSTEKNIFFGPGSGKNGGTIVEKSPRPEPIMFSSNFNVPENHYVFKDLYFRNIQIEELSIPKNRMIAITGESGCGKSTLVNECIVDSFNQLYKKEKIIIVGQDRNQSITSKSTIATFLELKKKLDKLSQNFFDSPIEDIMDIMPKDMVTKKRLELLLELGLGYLTLNRKTQSLSTGEFQCIHLISELYGMTNAVPTLFIFDEPSKGLSQNILNKFISCMREILHDESITIIMIEHNRYMLSNSDYIIDFGKRSENSVRKLDLIQADTWIKKNVITSISADRTIKSELRDQKGIIFLDKDGIEYFNRAENIFKGGILKNLSQTARWIYDEYDSEIISPVIAIDFERQLYSKNTFVYEIAGILNSLIATNPLNTDVESFDIYNIDNHCSACKGNGNIEVFDFDLVIENPNAGLWDGLIKNEIMTALKKYNFSKIKFLFKEIKKETKCDLSKSFNRMTDREKTIFMHGYWEQSFYDNQKKTTRSWKGILFLINKYMRQSKEPIKDILNNSKYKIICPICEGTIFNHKKVLKIADTDIREILKNPMKQYSQQFEKVEIYNRLKNIIGENTYFNSDVSLFPQKIQVILKLLEIEISSLWGYTIVLNNMLPYKEIAMPYLEHISKNNQVVVCDASNIYDTKEEILEKYFSKQSGNTYVFEILGYKKIMTEINKVRKRFPCLYCDGKKVIREEGLYEGIDVSEFPCTACDQTGLSKDGLNQIIQGISVSTWLNGKIKDIITEIRSDNDIDNIGLSYRLTNLAKKDLMNLYGYIDKRK